MKQIKLAVLLIFGLAFNLVKAQSPAFAVTGFNDVSYDQTPFAVGAGVPNVLTATNVANTYWNFHIGAIGIYTITQADHSTNSTYDGGIVATNVTPMGSPGGSLYQTFAFSTPGLTKFKLNSVKVKVDNNSGSPIPMVLAGVVGTTSGTPLAFNAPPGTNWITINTNTNPGFFNINGVICINQTGSANVAEMGFDDIDISAPITGAPLPSFTTHPANATTCVGGTASFNASATNAASYFWLVSNDGLIWNPITAGNAGVFFSGYNTNTLTVSNASLLLNNLYISVSAVNSTGGNQASNVARLYVNSVATAGIISGANTLCVGSNTTFNSTVSGGTWSTTGRASINPSTGVATGTSGGVTTVIYKVGSGICAATSTKSLTVNVLPPLPNIAYAPGTINPQAGATGGAFCGNRTFSVVGIPSGGTWSATGAASITSGGVVTTATVASGSTPGSIIYTFTNSNGCSNTKTLSGNVVKCTPKGVSSSNVENNFSVFPNPSKGSLKVNNGFVEAGTTATLINMMGKQVKTQNLSIGTNSIDVSTLPKGLYILNVTTNNKTTSQKVVVE